MKEKNKTKQKTIIFSITNHLLIILTSLSSLKQNLVVFLFPVTTFFLQGIGVKNVNYTFLGASYI